MTKTATYWIEQLNLIEHVEGGAFRETYRSESWIPQRHLPEAFKGDRNFSTAIYFLLQQGQFSALHRIASDEVWHFYAGDSLDVFELTPDGKLIIHKLGQHPDVGEKFQCVVKAGSWFGSRVAKDGNYALVGCTVAPGFDFADFELAQRNELLIQYPDHADIIRQLTR